MARDVFAPPPGFLFVQADYKQAEFRVAAMLSQDPVMIAAIVAGLDPHLETAKFISRIAWGIPPEAVTDEHRSQTKSVVFGVLFGKTAGSLAAMFGCSREQAQKIVDAVMGRYKVLARWIKTNLREAQNTGYVWTQWAGEPARRRPMFDIALQGDQNNGRRVHATNGIVNTPIQGGANEFQLASLADAVEWIEAEGIERDVKLLLPVHDSLLFEVRADMVDDVAKKVRQIMTSHDSRGVPLGVDLEVGPAWGSLSKWKDPDVVA
jgi:DNA polymerase I